MKFRLSYVLGSALAGALAGGGCAPQGSADDSRIDTIESAIRAVGYACVDIVSSDDVAGESDTYRVACESSLTYLANVSSTGNICVTAVPYIDSVAPAPALSIAERCVSASEI